MDNLETRAIIEIPAKHQISEGRFPLNEYDGGCLFAGLIILGVYRSIRKNYLWEMKHNLVGGGYTKLLSHPKSNFLHKFYLLGKPNEVIREALAEELAEEDDKS